MKTHNESLHWIFAPLRSVKTSEFNRYAGKKLMKIKKSIFYIWAIPITNSFAQDHNSDFALYPLQEGNYWEYSETHTNATIFVKQIDYSLEVIGDTVLSNNLQYKVIQKKLIPDTSQASAVQFLMVVWHVHVGCKAVENHSSLN